MKKKMNLAYLRKSENGLTNSEQLDIRGGLCTGCSTSFQGSKQMRAIEEPDPCPCESIFVEFGIAWG